MFASTKNGRNHFRKSAGMARVFLKPASGSSPSMLVIEDLLLDTPLETSSGMDGGVEACVGFWKNAPSRICACQAVSGKTTRGARGRPTRSFPQLLRLFLCLLGLLLSFLCIFSLLFSIPHFLFLSLFCVPFGLLCVFLCFLEFPSPVWQASFSSSFSRFSCSFRAFSSAFCFSRSSFSRFLTAFSTSRSSERQLRLLLGATSSACRRRTLAQTWGQVGQAQSLSWRCSMPVKNVELGWA